MKYNISYTLSFISYLLLCNNSFFGGSRIWTWLSLVLCFGASHKAAIRCQSGLGSYLRFNWRSIFFQVHIIVVSF